jgi:SAM-dependent methyltransferase
VNSYCIRDGYTPRLTPNYFADVQSDGKRWQPDVLPITAHLARINGAKRLVDIGCGRATGLLPYSREFDVVGMDYGSNIEHCRMNYDWGTWVSCDLENDIPDVDTRDAAIVCSDVIEHLIKPDNLLATIMTGVVCAKFAVITTPDRERVYGYDHPGKPGNVHHVREWTLDEMTALLESCGLNVAWRGWTVSNNVDRLKNTMLVILTRRELCYNVNIDGVFDVERK